MTLKICVAQLNFVVGDMAGNARKIIDAARDAHARGIGLLLTPELALCGYAAEDLFLRPAFIDACDDALKTVAGETAALKGLHIVVGHPVRVPGLAGEERRERSVSVASLYNAASVLCDGQVVHRYAKRELPNYQVFDERRYFVPGDEVGVFEVTDAEGDRVRVGLLICEDAWFDAPAADARAAGAELLVVINASPFHTGKGNEREGTMHERVQATGVPLVYAHLVGGQDEIVFEGRSFVLAADGSLAGRAISFEEALFDIAFSRDPAGWRIEAITDRAHSLEADLWHALVLGVRDYLGKNGFRSALIGLSGGVDSALTLCIAVDAIGAEHVRAVMMPSPYTAQMSLDDSRELVCNLGVRYDEVSIAPAMATFEQMLKPLFGDAAADTTEENVQARARMIMLMALSNKTGAIVLTTGNKSEMAVGYATLYGDMCGGYNALKDFYKTEVFELTKWRNANVPPGALVGHGDVIPERIITKPPSAELRPDQKDEDSLPPYPVLDDILRGLVDLEEDVDDILARGHDAATVRRIEHLVYIAEYKRRQAPPGVKVGGKNFGRDRRYPITNRFRDD